MILPFFDQANQQGPGSLCSFWLSTRITHGASLPCWALGTLHTRRSPSDVWAANISDFCFDEEPCQARPAIGEGFLGVVRVCRMVKDGCRVAMRIEPLRYLQVLALMPNSLDASYTHPMANVLQSDAGASAVIGSKMVLAERCSDVEGSNRMMLPCALPTHMLAPEQAMATARTRHSPKATFPFLIHVATRICSYDANLATSSPVNKSHTIAVEPASYETTNRPAPLSLVVSTDIHDTSSRCLSKRRSIASVSWWRTSITLRCA